MTTTSINTSPPAMPGSDPISLVERAARSILSLAPGVSRDALLGMCEAGSQQAAARGWFTPGEDELLRDRFARYLAARAGLLQTIDELRPLVKEGEAAPDESIRLRAFVAGYAAACLLVRAARFVVDHACTSPVVQRKLDEADPLRGVPRKQFTRLYRSLTSPLTAYALADSMRFADANREAIASLRGDALFGPVIAILEDAEASLRVGVRRYIKARLRYRVYSLRRRHVSAFRKAMFALFEASGRVIADMRNPLHRKRVTPEIIRQLGGILQPGDVIITRHDDAMSNLFLPGFWPHAALHIGPASTAAMLNLALDEARRSRWVEPIRMLEARKDGVLLRALEDTLRVDSFTIIRPLLAREHLAAGLARALSHEGKLYDFEFDFSRSDRLVCTEVVYRAFDGVGALRFEPRRRAGRLTLSAEDLLDLAIAGNGFQPVAVFGVPGAEEAVVVGSDVTPVLSKSYKESPPV